MNDDLADWKRVAGTLNMGHVNMKDALFGHETSLGKKGSELLSAWCTVRKLPRNCNRAQPNFTANLLSKREQEAAACCAAAAVAPFVLREDFGFKAFLRMH